MGRLVVAWIIIAILFLIAIVAAGTGGGWGRRGTRNTTRIEPGEMPNQSAGQQTWRESRFARNLRRWWSSHA
jgi:hypothetical protein